MRKKNYDGLYLTLIEGLLWSNVPLVIREQLNHWNCDNNVCVIQPWPVCYTAQEHFLCIQTSHFLLLSWNLPTAGNNANLLPSPSKPPSQIEKTSAAVSGGVLDGSFLHIWEPNKTMTQTHKHNFLLIVLGFSWCVFLPAGPIYAHVFGSPCIQFVSLSKRPICAPPPMIFVFWFFLGISLLLFMFPWFGFLFLSVHSLLCYKADRWSLEATQGSTPKPYPTHSSAYATSGLLKFLSGQVLSSLRLCLSNPQSCLCNFWSSPSALSGQLLRFLGPAYPTPNYAYVIYDLLTDLIKPGPSRATFWHEHSTSLNGAPRFCPVQAPNCEK